MISIALLSAVFIVGCSKAVEIENVAAPETIVLQSNNQTPHRIKISGKGKIEGTAHISLMLEGKPYKTEELSGDVRFEWANDWYSEEAVVEYKPGNATSGNLTLRYDF